MVLQALFEYWPQTFVSDEKNPEIKSRQGNKGYFSIPPHTPIFISEANGRSLARLAVKDAGIDIEQQLLNDYVPQWVTDVVVQGLLPKWTRLQFILMPHTSIANLPGYRLKQRDRLQANDTVTVRKICEHVCDKVLNDPSVISDVPGATQANIEGGHPLMPPSPNDLEILCGDTILNYELDLRTIKHNLWKQAGDPILYYRPIGKF